MHPTVNAGNKLIKIIAEYSKYITSYKYNPIIAIIQFEINMFSYPYLVPTYLHFKNLIIKPILTKSLHWKQ